MNAIEAANHYLYLAASDIRAAVSFARQFEERATEREFDDYLRFFENRRNGSMNAPLRIQIDDATKRKADCWDGLDQLSSDELLMIDQALTYYVQSRHLEATERQREQYRAKHTKRDAALAASLGAESAALRRKAADLSDLQDKITRVSDLYYMPPEEW